LYILSKNYILLVIVLVKILTLRFCVRAIASSFPVIQFISIEMTLCGEELTLISDVCWRLHQKWVSTLLRKVSFR